MKNYILMHKNDMVATLLLSDDSSTIDKSVTINDELLPLPARTGMKGLRDSDTLHFISPAPIFDNGNSMFYKNLYLPDLYQIEISSFAKTEIRQLKYVQNKNLIDFSRIPTISEMEYIYSKDPGYEHRRQIIEDGFLQKAEMLYDFCHGKSLNSRSVSFTPAE